MNKLHKIFASIVITLACSVHVLASDVAVKPPILITNANIFDGKNEKLATGMSVLVEKMLEKGCSETDCSKFLGGNMYRVMKKVWT